MKVRTFDLVNEGDVDCDLRYVSENGLMMLRTSDGRKIARHMSKCSFSREEFVAWCKERVSEAK